VGTYCSTLKRRLKGKRKGEGKDLPFLHAMLKIFDLALDDDNAFPRAEHKDTVPVSRDQRRRGWKRRGPEKWNCVWVLISGSRGRVVVAGG
jgi:hypothetical protein